ncbi:hypothetical protein [Serinicoccus kebangsaanensis]|uniref:hypothetical protein n=1 Tax=Serinicoccus kebangsaanensis TaxID=2602069 RepID=UPI00124F4D82|nr:hypothetical protein [Serinicoccus kebangsaanensis]
MAAELGSGSSLDVLDPVVDTWDEAIASVRNSAKWLVIVVATVATFLFGAGTLGARSELADAPVPLLLLAGVFGVTGIAALGEVAWRVADVFKPEVVSIEELTDETRKALRSSWWLAFRDEPPQERPEAELVTRLKTYRADLGHLDAAILAQQQTPGTAGGGARAALSRARDTLVEEQRQAHQLTATMMEMERYHRVKATRSLTSTTYVTAGMALVSALLFQLILAAATGAEEDAPAAGGASPSTSVVGWLSATEDGAEFWDAVGLASCRATADPDASPAQPAGGIPVLLGAGDGTAESPYVVQTLPEIGSDCPFVSFRADERFVLVQPVSRTVEVAEPTATQ